MSKYRRRSHSIVEEPGFFLKHWWHSFVDWASENRDQFITGVIAVLIIVAAGLLWRRHVQAMETQGWVEFGSPESAASLEAAAANYAGTKAGPFLKAKLADVQLAQGRTDEAISAYRQVSERTQGQEKKRALYSLARALESAGRFDEAKDTCEGLAAGLDFWAQESKKVLDELAATREAWQRVEEMKAKAAAEAEAAEAEAAAETGAEGEEPAAPSGETVEDEMADAASGGATDSYVPFDQPEELREEPGAVDAEEQ